MLLGLTDGGIIRRMNSAHSRPTARDLFSHTSGPGTSLQPGNPTSSLVPNATTATSLPRHILPSDLTNAIRRLEDRDLERLFSAVLAEQKRRGRNVPSSKSLHKRRQVEAVPVALTSGKLNAVRAAFKAGITLSRIARQFGISQSDVRKALASDVVKPRG
jgi:LysM repeat protein